MYKVYTFSGNEIHHTYFIISVSFAKKYTHYTLITLITLQRRVHFSCLWHVFPNATPLQTLPFSVSEAVPGGALRVFVAVLGLLGLRVPPTGGGWLFSRSQQKGPP